jgi:hypothetical protein
MLQQRITSLEAALAASEQYEEAMQEQGDDVALLRTRDEARASNLCSRL